MNNIAGQMLVLSHKSILPQGFAKKVRIFFAFGLDIWVPITRVLFLTGFNKHWQRYPHVKNICNYIKLEGMMVSGTLFADNKFRMSHYPDILI